MPDMQTSELYLLIAFCLKSLKNLHKGTYRITPTHIFWIKTFFPFLLLYKEVI